MLLSLGLVLPAVSARTRTARNTAPPDTPWRQPLSKLAALQQDRLRRMGEYWAKVADGLDTNGKKQLTPTQHQFIEECGRLIKQQRDLIETSQPPLVRAPSLRPKVSPMQRRLRQPFAP